MKHKLQRIKEIYKSTLNNSKWAASKLKEERELEKYNKRVKQNLNYTETETTDTNQQWEDLKRAVTTAARKTLGNLKQQPRKAWISEKTTTFIEQKKET
jgi:hypothetical protein